MDNKQAAEVLREIAFRGGITEPEACRRGADAIEMLEWLFEEGPWGRFCWRVMYDEWNGEGTFRAFCEARFEEHRKGLTK